MNAKVRVLYQLVNGPVSALVRDGDSLYLGGDFTRVGGVPSSGLASVVRTNGQNDRRFDTASAFVRDNGFVPEAIAATSDSVFIAGNFRKYQGTVVNHLAKVSKTTAVLDPAWALPNFNNSVAAVVADGDTLVAGGSFSAYRGDDTSQIVRIHATTGALVTSFATPADAGNVRHLQLYGGKLYALSSGIGSGPPHLMRFDPTSFALERKDVVDTSGLSGFNAMLIDESGIYLGGKRTTGRRAFSPERWWQRCDLYRRRSVRCEH